MNSLLSTSYNLTPHSELKTQLLQDPNIQKLFEKLDSDRLLVGAGVVYITKDFSAVRLREFKPVCRIRPIHVIIHEIPPSHTGNEYAVKITSQSRESRLIGEALGTALSCGAAVLGWMVVWGGAAAVPISGGTSSAITILAYGAATASSLQCFNGLYRTASELNGGKMNDTLDSQEWYTVTMQALDIISIAGAATSALAAFKAYQVVRSASSRSLLEILKGMSRAERKRITEEIIRVNHPKVSNRLLKQMIRGGQYPKRLSNTSINTALMLHLKDAIGATLSFSGSASSGIVRNAAIGIYEEI